MSRFLPAPANPAPDMPCIHSGASPAPPASVADAVHVYSMCVEHHILPQLGAFHEREARALAALSEGLDARGAEAAKALQQNRDRLMRISEIVNACSTRFERQGSVRTGAESYGSEGTGIGGGGFDGRAVERVGSAARSGATSIGGSKGVGVVSSEVRGVSPTLDDGNGNGNRKNGDGTGDGEGGKGDLMGGTADKEAGAGEGKGGGNEAEDEPATSLSPESRVGATEETERFSLGGGKSSRAAQVEELNSFASKGFNLGSTGGLNKKKRVGTNRAKGSRGSSDSSGGLPPK